MTFLDAVKALVERHRGLKPTETRVGAQRRRRFLKNRHLTLHGPWVHVDGEPPSIEDVMATDWVLEVQYTIERTSP